MDRKHLDALAEMLATTGSRRASLGALLGLALCGRTDALARPGSGNGRTRRQKRQHRRRQRRQRRGANGGPSAPGLGNEFCSGQSACVTPNAPNAYCTDDGICYCAVTRAGVPVCVSGAVQVNGGCQTDADCVNAVAGAYCIGASNQLQSPCIFEQSFCASPCRD